MQTYGCDLLEYEGSLLLMAPDSNALHCKIRKLLCSVVKIGKGEKLGEIRNNKERKIVESEMSV
jgi:hypothetical protein